MQCNDGAELRLGIVRKKSLERALCAEAGALPGNFLDSRDKFGIEREARFSEWNHGHRRGVFRRGRQNPGAGPRRFLTRLLAVEETHTHPRARKIERDCGADHSTARDGDVKFLHGAILSHPIARMTRAAGPLAVTRVDVEDCQERTS